MNRGFVTIATGRTNYYKIAANLLRSYRYYSKAPEPFAVICDRTNKYTDMFDKVILMENPLFSYVDKLRLPEYLPFDETIFIDSDCLAYKDLNDFWEVFKDADDFSMFGTNFPVDYEYGWFKKEDMGVYRDRVQFIPEFIGGVYYLRRTAAIQNFYGIVKHIQSTYHDYKFRQFDNVSDEAVFSLATAVCGFKTAGEKSPDVCFYPHNTYFESDITTGKVKYKDKYAADRGLTTESYMVHWGSGNTTRADYLLEVYRLDRISRGKPVTQTGLRVAKLKIALKVFVRRVVRKIKRILKSKGRR